MAPESKRDSVTRADRWGIIAWALAIAVLFTAAGFFGTGLLRRYKAETERSRQARIESATTDLRTSLSESVTAPGPGSVEVTTGVLINRIEDFTMDKATWLADFDIWFQWSGDGVSPGEHFEVPDGHIESLTKEVAFTEGVRHYARYNVRARMGFAMDAGRFPFGDQTLAIQVEDTVDRIDRLHYIADERDSGLAAAARPSNLKILGTLATTKVHVHSSRRGDPRLPEGGADVHSRFAFVVLFGAPGAPLFIKLFQALFASVAISLIVFYIKPTQVDPRFGLGVGAFFAAVSNNIYVRSFFPYSGRICLPDMVNALGLLTIFLTLVQSTVSLYLLDTLGREKARRLFDHVSFAVFLLGYVLVNAALVLAARS